MRRVLCYIATSLDGFIAGPGGELDWLGKPTGAEDYGYTAFMRGIRAIVMGRTTYEQVLESVADWPYEGIDTYVLSGSRHPGKHGPVIFTSEPVADLISRLRVGDGDIWLVGGGKTIAEFCRAGLVDEWIITVVPTILGEGVPMWLPGRPKQDLVLADERRYSSGFVQLRYVATASRAG